MAFLSIKVTDWDALDEAGRETFMDALSSVTNSHATTTLIATHRQRAFADLSPSIYRFQPGTPPELESEEGQ